MQSCTIRWRQAQAYAQHVLKTRTCTIHQTHPSMGPCTCRDSFHLWYGTSASEEITYAAQKEGVQRRMREAGLRRYELGVEDAIRECVLHLFRKASAALCAGMG